MSALSLGEPEAAALAEKAGETYRKLRWSLRWPLWRSSLRRQSHLLSLASRLDEQVEPLLNRARSRSRSEPEGAIPRLLGALQLDREALSVTTTWRLKQTLPLRQALVMLEGEAWRAEADRRLRTPRADEGWGLAEALIPPRLPEVSIVSQGAQLLESRTLIPSVREGQLPWSAPEVELLDQLLPRTEEALDSLWQRVAGLEPSGRLERFLRRMARSPRRERRTREAPRRTSGAFALVNGTFWCETARARLSQTLAQALPHIALMPAEQLPVLRWLSQVGHSPPGSPAPPLFSTETLSESRAALVEFTATWTALERAPGRPEPWWRLESLADRLDRLGGHEGRRACESGREPIRRFVHLRAHGRLTLPREASLVGWVRSAWALASVSRGVGGVRGEWGDA